MENSNSYHHGGTVGGTIGGTLLVILLQINAADIFKTCMLAAIGAVVSFIVSLCMKWILQRLQNYFKAKESKGRL
jgi:mannitol-specific phosphotransferase system IIBC component